MKKLLFILIIFFSLSPQVAQASFEDTFKSQMQSATGGIELEVYQGLTFDFGNTAAEAANGTLSLNPVDLVQKAIAFAYNQFTSSIPLLIQIIILCIITALLSNLQNSFGSGAGEIAFFACYAILGGLSLKVFTNCANFATMFLDKGVDFIEKLTPALMILLASSGKITTASLIQPSIIISTQFIAHSIKNLFLPLVLCSSGLSIASNLSPTFKLTNAIKCINNAIKWGLGIILTAFVAVISTQSIFAPLVDGKAIMGAEYAMKAFVPVVGSILADTVEMVAGCATLVKGAVGVADLIGVALLCAYPLLQILAQIGMLKISAAVVEPVADKRFVSLIGDIGGALTLIFLMVLTVSIMFIISLAMIVHIGGGAI